mgnify:CR=1 FL=1
MKKKSREYSPLELKKEILSHAKALKIPEKWSETIADRAVARVEAWIGDRSAVTESDIRRVVYQELKTLSPDLAYIYKTYGKII